MKMEGNVVHEMDMEQGRQLKMEGECGPRDGYGAG